MLVRWKWTVPMMRTANERAMSEAGDPQFVLLQPDLHRAAGEFLRQFLEYAVMPGDGYDLCPEFAAEDARRLVAQRAREGTAAQRAIDVDVAVGQGLGAVGDRADHHEIAAARVHLLAGADRTVVLVSRGGRRCGSRGRLGGCDGRGRSGGGVFACSGALRALVGGAELRDQGQA